MNLLICEKLDGISVSLKYNDGLLISGVTRGDGFIGEDITRNVKKMKGVIGKAKKFTGHIRGEIILLHSDWKKHFPDMANPRNAASGIAKRIDGYQSEHLTVISYTIEGEDFDTEEEAILRIQELGFTIPNYSVGDIKHVQKIWQKYMDKTRSSINYDIDGLVVRINDRAKQFALGEESGRPKGAKAYKFEAPEANTNLNAIVDQVGDTGQITPVAEFDSVVLLGAKVQRASLHNYTNIKTLGVNIGDTILVTRANDVIPIVKSVVKKNSKGHYHPPDKCPACGTKTIRKGEYLICLNKKDCPPQVIGRINKWVKELGILEWGESILTKLIEAGLISDIGDVYRLTADDIKSLDRMGIKGAKNLLDELDKFREVRLENFLGGLCIDGIATSTSKLVIDEGYDTLDSIMAMSIAEFEAIDGFGAIRAKSFHDGLIESKSRINDILKAGVKIKAKVKGSLSKKSFCFTGSMEIPRAKLQKMVVDAGGSVKKSVGKGLDYLVISDPNSTSSKAQAARKLDVKLISENEFLNMI